MTSLRDGTGAAAASSGREASPSGSAASGSTASGSTASGSAPVGSTLAIGAIVSVQFGAASAAELFPRIGPLATVSLRLFVAGLVLLAVVRPWRRRWSPAEVRAALVFGAVFTTMNVFLYAALDRLPQATVITLEFLGPLGVAIVTATGAAVRLWALPAAAGVVLLGGAVSGRDVLGVVFALAAACCWAAYILLSSRTGRAGTGLAGLTVGCVFGGLVMLPVGFASAGATLVEPGVLALGVLVGVLSSAVPYSLDLLALRRLPTAVFGVLTSLNPGVAALAGFLVLDQAITGRELAGVALVTLASVGVTMGNALRARATGRRR